MSIARRERFAMTDKEGVVVDILLVEDSPSDAMMTREALACSRFINQLHIVDDGVEAMDFLHRQGKHTDARRPGLVLLDLNLPRKGGLEVLKEIKEDPALRTIPVVVLTTSKAEEDVVRSYGAHANCYITKPIEFIQLADAVRAVGDFWLRVVTLPPQAN